MSETAERIWAARGMYTVQPDNRWPSPDPYLRLDLHEAEVAALRKAASSDYCAGFDAGFAASHENWNAETINRNDQREMDYLDNQRAAALAAYRTTKEGTK